MTNEKASTFELLQSWHNGDRKSLSALVGCHLPWIRAHVRRRLGDRLRRKEESLDIVQDAMVKILEYGPRFTVSNDRQFRALMKRIVENVICDKNDRFMAQCRRLSRERPIARDTVLNLDPPRKKGDTPSQAVNQREKDEWMRLGISLIDPEDREIIMHRLWDQLSWEVVGDRLGIKKEAARTRFRRAMGRLNRKLVEIRRGTIFQDASGEDDGED